MWDANKAVEHLNAHAKAHSEGHCARFVRQAIEAGGVTLQRTESAKNYGRILKHNAFNQVSAKSHIYQAGDVAVIQPYKGGNPNGHMAMFNGKIWISDFRQSIPRTPYPGPGYRKHHPAYAIYRHDASASVAGAQ